MNLKAKDIAMNMNPKVICNQEHKDLNLFQWDEDSQDSEQLSKFKSQPTREEAGMI